MSKIEKHSLYIVSDTITYVASMQLPSSWVVDDRVNVSTSARRLQDIRLCLFTRRSQCPRLICASQDSFQNTPVGLPGRVCSYL